MSGNPEHLKLSEFTQFIRGKVEHEDALRNNRMMWFVLIEGLLFAGLGALLKEKAILVSVLSGVGVLVSFSFAVLFFYGEVAMDNIKENWKEYCANNNCDVRIPVIGLDHLALREAGSLKKWLHSSLHLFLPWRFLPWVFGVTWALVWFLTT